jgi:hypothetical protein
MAMPRKDAVLISILMLSVLAGVLAIWALQHQDYEDTMEIVLSQAGCEAARQLGANVPTDGNCVVKAETSFGPYFKLSGGIRVSQELVLAWRPAK